MTHRRFQLSEADLHAHLKKRMAQRGVNLIEIEQVLNSGQIAASAKAGTLGKVLAIPYEAEWEGRFYEQKEITVYYKFTNDGQLILLTVLARYGHGF